MDIKLHKQAITAPKIRAEIQAVPANINDSRGMVERFNGRISDVLATRQYASGVDLEQTLKRYNWLNNHHIQKKALHHQSPISAMKEWKNKCHKLFNKQVINHAGSDTYLLPNSTSSHAAEIR